MASNNVLKRRIYDDKNRRYMARAEMATRGAIDFIACEQQVAAGVSPTIVYSCARFQQRTIRKENEK